MEYMQGFIMAGGRGTRLTSITNDEIPKPMIDVAGMPLLERCIINLKNYGITDIYMSVGHLAEKIMEYFKDGKKWDVNINYIIEDIPLGSAGSLFYMKGKVKEDLLIVSGDLLFDVDIDRMYDYHKSKNSTMTLFTHPNLHPYDSDIVQVDGDNRVLKFDYKNTIRDYYYKNNVNAGMFIVNNKALDYIGEVKKMNMEKDFVTMLISSGERVYAYRSPEYIKDIGTPERYEAGILDFTSGIVEKKCLKNKQKAIFIDRDGVINKYKGFVRKVEDIELCDGVCDAIGLINRSEYLAIIITNQPVIARGECTFEQVDEMFAKIETLLGKSGVYIDGVYYCPHHPHSGFEGEVKELKIECNCRKPKIGLLEQAAQDFNIDLSQCYMIGDSNVDIQTGINAGIPQIRVVSNLIEQEKLPCTKECQNLLEAVKYIIKE